MESNVPEFEPDPRLLRLTRESATNSICTGNGLFDKVADDCERVLPVRHKRTQVHVVLSFVSEFFLMETENVIDDVYSNGSGRVTPWCPWHVRRAYQ